MNMKHWARSSWPYDNKYNEFLHNNGHGVWVRNINRGKVYVIDTYPFKYVVSCGKHSDRSHSGCLYEVVSPDTCYFDALVEIDKRCARF